MLHFDWTVNPSIVGGFLVNLFAVIWYLRGQVDSIKNQALSLLALTNAVKDLHSLVEAMNTRLTRLESLDEGAQRAARDAKR